MGDFVDKVSQAASVGAALYFASTGNWTVAKFFLTVAYSAHSISAAQRAKRQARDAALASLQDRTITLRSSDQPQAIIYGEAKVGGVLIYACNHGVKKERLSMVIALAGHECDSINAVYVNDTTLSVADDFDADGWVKPGTKWYYDRTESKTQTITGPAPGGTITLDFVASSVDSVAWRDDSVASEAGNQVSIQQGSGWTIASNGRTITILDSRAQGMPVVVTYRTQAGGPLIRVKRYLGIDAGERDTDLEAASGGEWTAAHVGKGICRLHVTVIWNEAVFGAIGLPQFSARVRGKKVYNWSAGTTEWSRNAARCAADYLMSPLGFNVPMSSISTPDMQAAQAACDEDVPIDVSTNQKRYTVDGTLSTDADRRQNLQQMLTAMVGMVVWSGGKWIVRAGVYQSPVFTLGDNDLADGKITVMPSVARRDLFNSVKGRYVDVTRNTFLSTSFPSYVSSTYIAQDGGQQIDADIDLPMVGDADRAQRIAKLMLQRHRLSLTIEATYKFIAYAVTPGDTIYLKHSLYGWDTMNGGLGKLFTVVKREFSPTGQVKLTCKEEASAVYAWNYSEATSPDPAPNAALPDPTYVPPLTGFTVSSSAATYSRLSDGTVVPYALASWSAITDASVLNGGVVRVWWKRADESAWRSLKQPPEMTSVRLTPVSAGEIINVRGYAESALGVASVESFATHIVSTDLASANLAGTQSGNLLTNPSFASGTTGWTFVRPLGLTDPVEWKVNPTQAIPGNPTSAILYQGGSQNVNGQYVQSSAFPVVPGQRYVAFGYLLPAFCTGLLAITFYNAAGTVLADNFEGSVGDRAGSDPTKVTSFALTKVAAYAPPDAAFARVRVGKSATVSGRTFSGVYVHKPYAGPLNVATVAYDLPEWSGGAVQTVGTNQAEPNAFTDVVEVKSATSGTYTDKTTGTTYTWLGKIDIANPTDTPLQVIVSAVEDVQLNFTGTGVLKQGLALADDLTSVPIDPVYFATVASGQRGGGTLTVQRTFTARAQTIETYYLIGVVGAGSGALGAASDRVYGFPRMRAELVKR